MNLYTKLFTTCLGGLFFVATQPWAQEVLPFPEPTSASVAGKTLKDSKHQWRKAENHLPKDAPNIVIFMTDDALHFKLPLPKDVPATQQERAYSSPVWYTP
jgi:hypothetical protein